VTDRGIGVSIIIPTYNRARFVTKAIDSVLAQTYTDYELIVVDDGSTDGTKEALQPYMNRIRYIYQENSGVSAARNRGIIEAKGKWIAFLDSDDEWLPDNLSCHIEQLEKNSNICLHITNATIIRLLPKQKKTSYFEHCGFNKVGPSDGIIHRPQNLEFQIKYGLGRVQTAMVQKEIMSRIGLFDPALTICEDQDVMLKLALCGSWGVSSRQLAVMYRRQEKQPNLGQQLERQPIHSAKSMVYIYDKLCRAPGLSPYERSLVTEALASVEASLGVALLWAKRYKEARSSFRQSLSHNISIKAMIGSLISFLPLPMFATITRARHRLRFRRSIPICVAPPNKPEQLQEVYGTEGKETGG